MTTDAAEQALKDTYAFCDNQTGYALSPTEQVAAFNFLLDQPDAMSRFDRLAVHDNPASRLYALCAFQVADRERYDKLLSDLAPQKESVDTQFGCLGERLTMGEMAAEIDKYEWGRVFRAARGR